MGSGGEGGQMELRWQFVKKNSIKILIIFREFSFIGIMDTVQIYNLDTEFLSD